MKLHKCPRCDLNYIQESEKYCKVCLREMKGEPVHEDMEMCSVCNAAPSLPGHDVCLSCLKEMNAGGTNAGDDDPVAVTEVALGMNSVSTMDEIIPQIREDIPESEIREISLESVREDEEEDEDDEDDEDGLGGMDGADDEDEDDMDDEDFD